MKDMYLCSAICCEENITSIPERTNIQEMHQALRYHHRLRQLTKLKNLKPNLFFSEFMTGSYKKQSLIEIISFGTRYVT